MPARREFLTTCLAAGTTLGAQALLPAWARTPAGLARTGLEPLGGREFALEVARRSVLIDGRRGHAVTVNGSLPAPLLRWREGDTVTLRVTNRLHEDTSIHWHGILLPFEMDGVPGVTFPGIRPGETFTYRFPVRQAGTYWYHSHSGLQEPLGHYGPLIIDPAQPEPAPFDREHVLVLSDWAFVHPHRLFDQLKTEADSLNFNKRTLGDLLRDLRRQGPQAALEDRLMWGAMGMDPTDIADITGATFTYLVNGHGPADNWTGLFRPGERVRLRVINASSMTFFNVRIPGLPMTVVQADGMNLQPVETDEFQIGVAETYDLIVEPPEARAYTLMCESMDRSGYARATLAPRPGMSGPVPPLRERPLLTMKDMGMAHGTHGDNNGTAPRGSTAHHGSHAGHDGAHRRTHGGAHGSTHGEGQAGHMAPPPAAPQRHAHPAGPGVANLAMQPVSRLHEPGTGLEQVPHRALTYSQLRSLEPNADPRPPGREIELHLTGNMERYMWSFDGVKFSEVREPIRFVEGERLRLTMVNDTMMAHPIHLHGMFFQLVNGGGRHQPDKHTVIVKPGEKLSVDVTADAVGDWAFHCHLLHHMHAGMFQVVAVRPAQEQPA